MILCTARNHTTRMDVAQAGPLELAAQVVRVAQDAFGEAAQGALVVLLAASTIADPTRRGTADCATHVAETGFMLQDAVSVVQTVRNIPRILVSPARRTADREVQEESLRADKEKPTKTACATKPS